MNLKLPISHGTPLLVLTVNSLNTGTCGDTNRKKRETVQGDGGRRKREAVETDEEVALRSYGSRLRYECGLARMFVDPETGGHYQDRWMQVRLRRHTTL